MECSDLPADRLPSPWRDERQAVAALRAALTAPLDWSAVRQRCEPWIASIRRHPGPPWALESLLREFPLSTQEGLGLMRLAEALLRVPDADTALALTADQLKSGAGRPSPSWTTPKVAATDHGGVWATLTHHVLALSQSLLPRADHAPSGWLERLGGPTVVAATVRAVQLLGQQFVLGQTIDEALDKAATQASRASAQGQRLCFSFDMLGEGARTWEDAERYLHAYRHALGRLADAAPGWRAGQPPDGLSIKLSALHPRLESAHTATVLEHLLPRLTELAHMAARAQLLLTLDAEESWRLELQVAVLDGLMQALDSAPPDSTAAPWQGLGLAVQAYQHRALPLLDEVARLARQHRRPLTVRLVKGAYWDAELKRAQEMGLPGFPVYRNKAHTDLSYLACAQRLMSHAPWLRAQFATHNAATVAAVMQLAQRLQVPPSSLEWQRLHGMGESTWREILSDPLANDPAAPATLRIYAPVGSHRDLLAYLVRRLLENGANASFVHQLADPQLPLETLLASPLESTGLDDAVDLPADLFGAARRNAAGLDTHHGAHRERLRRAWQAAQARSEHTPPSPTSAADASTAMQALARGALAWEATPAEQRCQMLERAADRLEDELEDWAADLVMEGHKTWPDAVAEVRETIDFARYYASQAREWLLPRELPGPTGERNTWRLRGRGVWVCISPWNFPLAIFGGQVMAALVMGNAVAAKPAEQTPRIALRLTETLHAAGVPRDALACLPGTGQEVGTALVAHPACAGVAFTGSVATALRLSHLLCGQDPARPRALIPLIAETGGLNALIADSTALPEQLIDSVVSSAFGSAGQRCSALRLLCVHTAIADQVEAMLAGAMQTLVVGAPAEWRTDVGPVIDENARQRLGSHIARLSGDAASAGSGVRLIGRAPPPDAASAARWPFVVPVAYALPNVGALTQEHFGPVLHVVRWGPGYEADTLDALIDQINASGFGLTLGVHTRIDTRVDHIARRLRVGNVYVNRGMTGAVVGSQPFGGQGLSGTGPKAGGPLYLPRFATEQVVCINTAAAGGNAALLARAGATVGSPPDNITGR